MTREEFRTIREDLGLSTERFGRALGYQGSYGTAARHIRRFESGARSIPQAICRLLEMFRRHGVPDSSWLDFAARFKNLEAHRDTLASNEIFLAHLASRR